MLTFREIELINIKHFEPRGCVIIGRVMKVMKGWGHNMNILLQYFVQVTGGRNNKQCNENKYLIF